MAAKVFCSIECCPVCGGTGIVVVSCLLRKDGTMKPIVTAECIVCNGSGRRIVEEAQDGRRRP